MSKNYPDGKIGEEYGVKEQGVNQITTSLLWHKSLPSHTMRDSDINDGTLHLVAIGGGGQNYEEWYFRPMASQHHKGC
jgi:hypothetical protein